MLSRPRPATVAGGAGVGRKRRMLFAASAFSRLSMVRHFDYCNHRHLPEATRDALLNMPGAVLSAAKCHQLPSIDPGAGVTSNDLDVATADGGTSGSMSVARRASRRTRSTPWTQRRPHPTDGRRVSAAGSARRRPGSWLALIATSAIAKGLGDILLLCQKAPGGRCPNFWWRLPLW